MTAKMPNPAERWLILWLVLMMAPASIAVAEPPNVVVIIADDLGYGDLGAYGGYAETPNIDALAERGAMALNFTTAPACSPARAALMTGRFAWSEGVGVLRALSSSPDVNRRAGQRDWLNPRLPNLPRYFSGLGYATGFVGKWHLGNTPGAPHPSEYGFDRVWCLKCSDPALPGWPTFPHDPYFRHFSTAALADEALAFIDETGPDQPFLVVLSLLQPHAPLHVPPEELRHPEFDPPFPDLTSALNVWLSTVEAMDEQLGPFLDALPANTIVAFLSDNGPESILVYEAGHSGVGDCGPYRGGKRSVLECGIKVPLIIAGPGIPRGLVVDAEITAIDMRATLAGLARAPFAEVYTDGHDASAAFRGHPWRRTRPILQAWPFVCINTTINCGLPYSVRDVDRRGRTWVWMGDLDGDEVLYLIDDDPLQIDARHDQPAKMARLRSLAMEALGPAR